MSSRRFPPSPSSRFKLSHRQILDSYIAESMKRLSPEKRSWRKLNPNERLLYSPPRSIHLSGKMSLDEISTDELYSERVPTPRNHGPPRPQPRSTPGRRHLGKVHTPSEPIDSKRSYSQPVPTQRARIKKYTPELKDKAIQVSSRASQVVETRSPTSEKASQVDKVFRPEKASQGQRSSVNESEVRDQLALLESRLSLARKVFHECSSKCDSIFHMDRDRCTVVIANPQLPQDKLLHHRLQQCIPNLQVRKFH